jgi:hypothetical protein
LDRFLDRRPQFHLLGRDRQLCWGDAAAPCVCARFNLNRAYLFGGLQNRSRGAMALVAAAPGALASRAAVRAQAKRAKTDDVESANPE